MLKFLCKIVYTAIMLVEGVILIDIVLIAVNANMDNSIARIINNLTSIFISPFNGLIDKYLQVNNTYIPLLYIVVIAIYAIVAFIFSEIIKTLAKGDSK